MRKFHLQRDDAERYFKLILKPRLDRSHKLYVAYGGDRAKQIKKWQANVSVPYIQAVIETLMPRILDARPDFSVIGRTEKDHAKAEKQVQMGDYLWELAQMDKTAEEHARAALINGTAFLQVSWKKDVRTLKFLDTKDINAKSPKWKEEERTFYDAPYCEWVDNYALWYDWHNTERKLKQYWFKRKVLPKDAIMRQYPMFDKKRLEMACASGSGDLTDYAAVRQEVKTTHESILKGATTTGGLYDEKYNSAESSGDMQMFEVYEWYRPFDDEYSVHVGAGYVPILKNGFIPIPFDFKEAPFIDTPFLKIPGEFEGMGLPLILESLQIMLNMIKNQRLDATTLSIHKMWIVNPLANINRDELVTRPFGIIYSIDPQGVREVQFSDIKGSAYKEEETLKSDMRYASGVDDFSMGVGGSAGSATEVRHLRESTLERVRLFVNHLGDSYAEMLRYWMDMSRQFYTKEMTIRVIGEDGADLYPLIEKDDLMGFFDYKATVLPSIAGQQDIKKKQDMDLFQLLVQLPFVDQKKLTGKVISDWGWSLDGIVSDQSEQQVQQGMEGDPNAAGMDPMQQALMGGAGAPPPGGAHLPDSGLFKGRTISPSVARQALALLRTPDEMAAAGGASPFAQANSPINLLTARGVPPTPRGVPGPASNPRGHNRNGKVNTNIPMGNKNTTPEGQAITRATNLQR